MMTASPPSRPGPRLPPLLLLLVSLLLRVASSSPRRVVIGVDGGTESIRACCFDAETGAVVGSSSAAAYATSHPRAGWAEQSPEDWYACLRSAVGGAVASAREGGTVEVLALCADTTCCSVVALGADREPLRPCLLWMDARSAGQAARIVDAARSEAGDAGRTVLEAFPELRVNSNGEGPISAEWLLPKSMWIKENEPEVWERAEVICEYQDYINHKLTGRMVASSCNAAVRWHHDGRRVLLADESDPNLGRPMRLLEALGMEDLADKLPRTTLAMGDVVGGLTKEAAEDLGLEEGTPVVQGGPDAFVGMIGLGTVKPNSICLITGSSHLHCLVTPSATSAPGTWGAYRGAPLSHLNFSEGGQSSTGSLVRWVRDLVSGDVGDGEKIPYGQLDEEASAIEPGCDGLVALETWQGSRTPVTDARARGAFVGLTLSHGRAHLFRSVLEAVCYGTRACLEGLEDASGTEADEVVVAGGATRSPLWLQLHADVTGKKFVLNENTDGPLLGCAILASVGAGVYGSVEEAAENMVRRSEVIEPRPEVAKAYDRLYDEVYKKVRPGVRDTVHAMAALRGGASDHDDSRVRPRGVGWGLSRLRAIRGGDGGPIISPSLLAADWSDMKGEVQKCIDAGLTQLHVDVFDGVYIDSPLALTFGPQMVEGISSRFGAHNLTLDVHLCVDRPQRYAAPMARAGASRIIFQWEAMVDSTSYPLISAIAFADTLRSLGVRAGVSINPSTSLSDVYPLLDTGLIDVVDVLAVEAGFGGQEFNAVALEKIKELRTYRDQRLRSRGKDLKILVDGGIKQSTSKLAAEAGADILVAGTALFRHSKGFDIAVDELRR